ncbi:hypothetical protein C8R46DRAFT_1234772 [Mycena filopes]|nr:hypothetical protein C8R46DRAFT_1234772 [Mycena filopes]
MSTDQEEAQDLLNQLQKGVLDQDLDRLDFDVINYNRVSTETCTQLLSLLQQLQPPTTPSRKSALSEPQTTLSPVNKTPAHVRATREIDFVISQRVLDARKRVVDAQRLQIQIRQHVLIIFKFLQAARRTNEENFGFPFSAAVVLESLGALGTAFGEVEVMVRLNNDLEGTEADSEEEGDLTRVA